MNHYEWKLFRNSSRSDVCFLPIVEFRAIKLPNQKNRFFIIKVQSFKRIDPISFYCSAHINNWKRSDFGDPSVEFPSHNQLPILMNQMVHHLNSISFSTTVTCLHPTFANHAGHQFFFRIQPHLHQFRTMREKKSNVETMKIAAKAIMSESKHIINIKASRTSTKKCFVAQAMSIIFFY